MATIEPLKESAVRVQDLPAFDSSGAVAVSMLRLDAIHPFISGNKWYKLKYNIESALVAGKNTLLSFGGAYSNHLLALAAATYQAGLASVGIVRGEPGTSNHVLQKCREYGMQLQFISREAYARKEDPVFLQALETTYPGTFMVPEGGANAAGRKGAGEIAPWIDASFTHILLSVGTGTTFAGLRNTLPVRQHLVGFAPMKGGIYLEEPIRKHLLPGQDKHWQLTDRFHFGGFGKKTEELDGLMSDFETRYGFALDRVYTAKMMAGLQTLLLERQFPGGSKLLCIHTGGLGGN